MALVAMCRQYRTNLRLEEGELLPRRSNPLLSAGQSGQTQDANAMQREQSNPHAGISSGTCQLMSHLAHRNFPRAGVAD